MYIWIGRILVVLAGPAFAYFFIGEEQMTLAAGLAVSLVIVFKDSLISKSSSKIISSGSSSGVLVADATVFEDGRILDLVKTKFLTGKIIIAKFVIDALQTLSKTHDATKRNRAKRGLDIIAKLKLSEDIKVEEYDASLKNSKDINIELVNLAKKFKAKIITLDFDLIKDASLENIQTLDMARLADALSPIYLPGEELMVFLGKEGAQANQAVGFLDDGTMVVAEDGKKYIGKRVGLVMTSIIQSSSGKMLFGKIADKYSDQNSSHSYRRTGKKQ